MKAVSLRFPQTGVVLIAVVFIAMFFVTALPRLLYPYDLDFIEDSMLMQSLQIAQGQPVYIPPNADFNPHIYVPLFPWLRPPLHPKGLRCWRHAILCLSCVISHDKQDCFIQNHTSATLKTGRHTRRNAFCQTSD